MSISSVSQLIQSPSDLRAYLEERSLSLADCGLEYLESLPLSYPLRFSRYYADLIDWSDPQDPLKYVAVPRQEELNIQPYELTDPIGDHDREAVPGLIHRYPDRCLLLLTTHCRIHCRFCFRRDVVGKVRPVDFSALAQYLKDHEEVSEIIFSGGDPGTFPPAFMERMAEAFLPLSHVKVWRFHTRVPAVDPLSLQDGWFNVMQKVQEAGKQVIVVTHVDHSREVTPQFENVVRRLQKIGVIVISQSVLLKKVNADSQSLEDLFRALLRAGVKPYYLHHPDKVVGTSHFRVSIEEGKKLYRSLRGKVSTPNLPEYVIDFPGGMGKLPVFWLEHDGAGTYRGTNFRDQEIIYKDPAFSSQS